MKSRIASKLLFAFGVILMSFTCFVVYIAYQISVIAEASTNMVEKNSLIQKFGIVEGEIRQTSARTVAIVLSDGSTVLNMFQKAMQDSDKSTEHELSSIEESLVNPQLKLELEQHSKLMAVWSSLRKDMLKARSEGDVGAAREVLQTQFLDVVGQLIGKSRKLVEMQAKEAHFAQEKLDLAFKRLYLFGSVFFLASLCIAVYSSTRIGRFIVKGLGFVRTSVSSIGQGDLATPINCSGSDEIAEILRDLEAMQERLVEVVSSVQTGAHQVAMASAEIALGNLSLSNRTEGLVGTIGETTTFMMGLHNAVSHNAESSVMAGKLANAATQQAEVGTEVVRKMEQTMQAIDESSKKIAEITGVIDALAFQTNILALNAAVEAARAGEHGRGFAVVASEVRLLAGKSADAAKSIRVLIDDSVLRVTSGNALISKVGDSVRQIRVSIHSLERLVHEISTASASQSQGVTQVNESIKYMDNFTQENASLVEEVASAAESTGQQAADLLEVVKFFKVQRSSVLSHTI